MHVGVESFGSTLFAGNNCYSIVHGKKSRKLPTLVKKIILRTSANEALEAAHFHCMMETGTQA